MFNLEITKRNIIIFKFIRNMHLYECFINIAQIFGDVSLNISDLSELVVVSSGKDPILVGRNLFSWCWMIIWSYATSLLAISGSI